MNATSTTIASITDSTPPSTYFVGKNVWRPSVMSWPSPPYVEPRMDTTVASPINVTAASRSPANIRGTARGISTRMSRSRGR